MGERVSVNALVRLNADGSRKPLGFIWEDGRKILVDRVLDFRKSNSAKIGGGGDRYTCMVAGRTFYMYDENDIWSIERR